MNKARAVTLVALAAKLGDLDAIYNLDMCHMEDIGVTRDEQHAVGGC